MDPYKNLCMNVHCIFTQWTIHKMLLNNKMEQAVGINNVDESQKHHAEWKRSKKKAIHIVTFNLYEYLERAKVILDETN